MNENETQQEITDEKTLSFTTECKGCIFAKVIVDDLWGLNDQQECTLNRLNEFKRQDLAKLTDSGYYTINTICKAYRDEEWAEQFEDQSSDSLKEEVNKQIEVQCDFIVLAYEDDNLHLNLIKTAKGCLKQTIKPCRIIFVVKVEKVENFKETYTSLNEILNDKIEYSVMRVFGEQTPYECIDEAFSKIQSPWYIVLKSGMSTDYISKLNNIINTAMKRIIMIKETESNIYGFAVLSTLHKMFGGSKNIELYKKIEEAVKQQEMECMVTTW